MGCLWIRIGTSTNRQVQAMLPFGTLGDEALYPILSSELGEVVSLKCVNMPGIAFAGTHSRELSRPIRPTSRDPSSSYDWYQCQCQTVSRSGTNEELDPKKGASDPPFGPKFNILVTNHARPCLPR
jgi:hypothetical protein